MKGSMKVGTRKIRSHGLRTPCRLLLSTLGLLVLLRGTAAQTPNPLIEQLKSPNADQRSKAASELGKKGESSAVPALTAALNDPSAKVRREVVVALAEIRGGASLDGLITASRDTDPQVRVVAVDALSGYYLGRAPSVGLMGGLKHATETGADESVRIDPGVTVDPKVIAALQVALEDTRSIEAARHAAKGLGILMAKSSVPALVKAAHSPDEDLAREALNSLGKIKDLSAGPQLVDLLQSSKKAVKQEAVLTVGILRTRSAASQLQLLAQYHYQDKKTRRNAFEGLAYIGDPVSYDFFIRTLGEKEKAYRAYAAEGLGRIGDKRAIPELEKALAAETDGAARLAEEFALTKLGESKMGELVAGLGSSNWQPALAYLIELGRDPQVATQLPTYLHDKDANIRRRLCTVLMFVGNAASVAPLEQASKDSNNDVAAEALRALRAVRSRTGAT
jgi:HEAT repeat protein